MSETPPSPVRKFLSCVHITLSSRVRNSELHSTRNAGNGMEVWDKPQGRAQAVTLKAAPEASVESVPEFPPAEGVPEDPSSAVPAASADPSRVFSSRQELLLQGRARAQLRGDSGAPGATGIPSSTLPAKPGRRTSDAATQITTESPTKTTFSAEVCVDPQEGGNAAQQPLLTKAPEPPSVTTSSHKEIPPFPRQPGEQIPVLCVSVDLNLYKFKILTSIKTQTQLFCGYNTLEIIWIFRVAHMGGKPNR